MQECEELTRDRFEEFIAQNSFKYRTVQVKLCFQIIKRMYKRCTLGYYFGDIKVCKSKEMVVEGNHRYLAYLLVGIEFEVIDWTSSYSDVPIQYNGIKVDFDEDWDEFQKETRMFLTDDFLKDFERRTTQ